MDLQRMLLAEHSKKQCGLIVDWIGKDSRRFGQLMDLFFHGEYRITQRAAWPMSYCVRNHPELINPFLKPLIENLQKSAIHDAIRRNTLRILQDIRVPARLQGRLMTICFELIQSPKSAAAIKAFALTVLDNLARDFPEIQPELVLVIKECWPFEKASFHARARKILKKLEGNNGNRRGD